MTSREPPQLDTDGDLDGSRCEVLFLLAGLQLDQDLVELKVGNSVSSHSFPSSPPRICPQVILVSPVNRHH